MVTVVLGHVGAVGGSAFFAPAASVVGGACAVCVFHGGSFQWVLSLLVWG